eukprot:6207163-Pleurochrysis_carterae.AAC.2
MPRCSMPLKLGVSANGIFPARAIALRLGSTTHPAGSKFLSMLRKAGWGLKVILALSAGQE